jgi:hypothetical protein
MKNLNKILSNVDASLNGTLDELEFDNPDDVVEKIFNILLPKYGLKCDSKEIKKIIQSYPNMVGRDIRNVCKLLKQYNSNESKITFENVQEFSEYLAFNQ